MKSNLKYVLFSIFIIIIGIGIISFINENWDNEHISSNTNIDTSNIDRGKIFLSKYSKSSNKIVATIKDEEITEKELALYEAYNDEENIIEKIVEDKIILKCAEDNNIVLDEEDNKRIRIYKEKLENNDIYESEEFKNSGLSKEEFVNIMVNFYKDIAIQSKYKSIVRQNLLKGNLPTDNEDLNRKIKNFNKKYVGWTEKWQKGKLTNKEIEKIYKLQEEMVEEYLKYIVEKDKSK